MDSNEAKRPHAILLPFPAQGHIIPFTQLAKLLHSTGFHITFVNIDFTHKRVVYSEGGEAIKGLPDFRFEVIPDGLPPDKEAIDAVQLGAAVRNNCPAPFLDLLKRLNSAMDVPPITCIISDGMMSFAIKAAEEIGIPQVQFWTASACGFMAYLHYADLVKTGIVPFSDESFMNDGTLDSPVDWIPGMYNMRLKDFPSFMRTTDMNDFFLDFLGSESENCLTSSMILFNTFDELEQEVLNAIAEKFHNIYTVGPLSLLTRHLPRTQINTFRLNLWKEDSKYVNWLDKWQPSSVVYANFGSMTVMSENLLKEFAWGLANSKLPFLWIVRPDIVAGKSAVFPEEFFSEIKDRGMLIPWCSQEKVLSHPAVAVFLTHCGWNSILETVCAGKPIICWPFFAEQTTNCRYACTKWGIGMEIYQVKREAVEALIREMMEGEKVRRLKENALEWKSKAEAATDVGGSSHKNFKRFITEALLNRASHE